MKQQNAARTKLESQIEDLPSRPTFLSNSGERYLQFLHLVFRTLSEIGFLQGACLSSQVCSFWSLTETNPFNVRNPIEISYINYICDILNLLRFFSNHRDQIRKSWKTLEFQSFGSKMPFAVIVVVKSPFTQRPCSVSWVLLLYMYQETAPSNAWNGHHNSAVVSLCF